MTIEELYQKSGNDYNEILGRLTNGRLIERLVKRYLDDSNYKQLCEGVQAQNQEKIFTAAHTIKGIALNLGFRDLAQAASEMTEATRDSYGDNIPQLFEKLKIEQEKITQLIQQLQ